MFVQFLHDQLLKLATKRNASGSSRQIAAARGALHWATFLTRDPLFIPTVDLAQSPIAEALASDLALLAREDFVQFVGSSVDVDEIYRSKRTHFNRTSLLAPWEDREARDRLQRFESSLEARRINTTTDLKMRWMGNVGRFLAEDGKSDTPLSSQIRQVGIMLGRSAGDRRLADALGQIPKRLEDHAFLWQVVEDLRIFPFRTTGQPRRQLEIGLAWEWIMSHLDEYRTTLLVRLAGIGPMDFGVSETNPSATINLSRYREAMDLLGLKTAIESLTLSEIVALRHDPNVLAFRDGFLANLYEFLQSGRPRADAAVVYALCERIRVSVSEQRTPLKAVSVAAGIGGDLEERAPRISSRERPISIGIMVALAEELEALKGFVEQKCGPVEAEHSAKSGLTIFRVSRYTNGRGKKIDLFFSLVGKGQEDAAAATALVLSEHEVDVAVNIGIAGALSDDVSLGDVVSGTEVVSYLANSKAEGGSDGSFEIKFGGKTAMCDIYLTERIADLKLGSREAFEKLTNELLAHAHQSLPGSKLLEGLRFDVVSGPIASGPIVAAAPGFKDWILNIRRDLVAVEMEASGVGIAVGRSGQMRHVRFLALRGISDLADDEKKNLEGTTKGAVRKIATIAPMAVLLAMLDELPSEALVRAY